MVVLAILTSRPSGASSSIGMCCSKSPTCVTRSHLCNWPGSRPGHGVPALYTSTEEARAARRQRVATSPAAQKSDARQPAQAGCARRGRGFRRPIGPAPRWHKNPRPRTGEGRVRAARRPPPPPPARAGGLRPVLPRLQPPGNPAHAWRRPGRGV